MNDQETVPPPLRQAALFARKYIRSAQIVGLSHAAGTRQFTIGMTARAYFGGTILNHCGDGFRNREA